MNDDTEMLRRIALANAYSAHMHLRVEGMKAENELRKFSGLPPKYEEKHFLVEDMTNHIIDLLSR
jgi:hypothetical protein